MQKAVQVSQLYIYPLKSAAPVAMEHLPVDSLGPRGDRRFMLVDAAGDFITQRSHPELTLLQVQLLDDELKLKAPGAPECSIPVPAPAEYCQFPGIRVRVWQDQVNALELTEARAYCSTFLNTEVRLVYYSANSQRHVDPDFARDNEMLAFADGFPMLLCNEASLADFNRHLDEPVSMLRFRPNLVIKGAPAYAEDSWTSIRIGGIHLDLVKPCSRCVMPAIDPATAQKQSRILTVLNQTRRAADRKVYFGQNLLHRGEGIIRVGDPVEIL